MSFLAMLIALALHPLLQERRWPYSDRLWQRWSDGLQGTVVPDGLRLPFTLLLPAAAFWWALHYLEGVFFGLPSLACIALLLLWALGREDYRGVLERYQQLHDSGEYASAARSTGHLWCPSDEAGSVAGEADSPEAAQELARCRLIYIGYQRWFAPVALFLLLGPVAAAGYRAVHLRAQSGRDPASLQLLAGLDWLPSRLLVATFALTGDFTAVLSNVPIHRRLPAPQLLLAGAMAACGNPSARLAGELLYRSAGLWVACALALFFLT